MSDPATVYRDATYSAETQSKLKTLVEFIEGAWSDGIAFTLPLRDVIERWDANEMTEAVFAVTDRTDWPVHQPGPAYDAPIPGIHWYGGCEPGYPKVDPDTGICEGCGELACSICGKQDCPDHGAPQ